MSGGLQLWQRRASVIITRRGGAFAGKKVSALRVSFEGEKNAGNEIDIFTVTVWNPSDETISDAIGNDKYIVLNIAYGGANEETLFEGDIVSASVLHEAPERKLVIKVGDGFEASKTRGTKSWKPGISFATIAQDIANEMKAAKGIIVKSLLDAFKSPNAKAAAEKAVNGYSVNGNLLQKLNEICDERGLEVAISGNELIVMPKNGYRGKAILLNPDTGLLGSPQRETDKKTKQDTIVARSLIVNTDIRPYALLRVESAEMSVNVAVRSVKFQGDTHGNEWYAVITGVPV